MFISYAGGFVRRGLFGEILYHIVHFFGINEQTLIIFICAVAYIFVTISLLYFLYKRKYTWWIVASPFLCGMVFYVIRKDFILYSLLIISLLLLRRRFGNMRFIAVVALNIIALLIHEAYIFWGIPVITLSLASLKKKHLSRIFLIGGFCIFLLLSNFKGNEQIAYAIIDRWNGIIDGQRLTHDHASAIMALGWDLKETIKFHFFTNFHSYEFGWLYLVTRPLYGLLVFWFLSNIIFSLKRNSPSQHMSESSPIITLSCILAMEYICMIPMFTILSCDFGRSVQHIAIASYSMFLILGSKSAGECLPKRYLNCILALNRHLNRIVKPRFAIMIILLLTLGEAPFGHSIVWSFNQSPIGSLISAL